ncbi:MAG TPA: uridine kinase [Myxococcota bacterium]|nr:uridine kinase [Myxococcota bacterium]
MAAPICVGLAGGTGAGKTSLADALARAVGAERVLRIAHDAYYRDHERLSSDALAALNFDHPDALETELLVAHLGELRAGRAVEVPVYDFSRHRRAAQTLHAEPRPLVLVDGILVLADPSLRACFDLAVFVDAPEPLRRERRIARDVAERGRSRASVRAQLETTVAPMHAAFVAPSRAHAALWLDNGGALEHALAPLAARVRELLAQAERR